MNKDLETNVFKRDTAFIRFSILQTNGLLINLRMKFALYRQKPIKMGTLLLEEIGSVQDLRQYGA